MLSLRKVLVCQNRACRKYGSAEVLAAFLASPVENVAIVATSCMGQCGNGPMALVLPEEVWYWRLSPHSVPAIVEQHLRGGYPVKQMLYPKFGDRPGKRD